MSAHTIARYTHAIEVLNQARTKGTPGLWEVSFFESWGAGSPDCAHIITSSHGDTVAEVSVGADHEGPRPVNDNPMYDASLMVILHNSVALLVRILEEARQEEIDVEVSNRIDGTSHRGPSKIVPLNKTTYDLAEFICNWSND